MLKVKTTLTGGPKEMKKNFRAAIKDAMQHAVTRWHRFFLPGHFTDEAATKYGYAQRSQNKPINRKNGLSYDEKKKRKGLPPLVWTGAGKAMLTGSVSVTGTVQKAAGTMNAPWYMTIKKAKGPDMVKEITATTEQEQKAMADVIKERAIQQIETLTYKEVLS